MKKILSLLLCMVMIFTLFGCDSSDHEESTGQQTEPPVTTAPTAPVVTTPTTEPDDSANIYDAPLVSLSMPIVSEIKTAKDSDAVIFHKRFQNVRVNSFVSHYSVNVHGMVLTLSVNSAYCLKIVLKIKGESIPHKSM